jgi:hypothetical protein
MKNTLTLLLSVAMVATGYYFYKKNKETPTVPNINLAFNKDSALQVVQNFYKNESNTLANNISKIEVLDFRRKGLDTVMASFAVIATPKKIKIGGQDFTYKYTEYWKYYYANSKWQGLKSNKPW